MSTIIYPQGTVEETVPANEKIAIFGYSSLSLYKQVGYPNYPTTWDLLYTTADGETYTTAAFTAETVVKVEAGAAGGLYEIGTAPVVGEPSPDITAAATPFVVSGLSAAQGGSAQVIGGPSSTTGNAGGAALLTGGVAGATGVGGAVTIAAGAGGTTSGAGGALTITGGAGTLNANGGAVTIKGGVKNGSGTNGGLNLGSAITDLVGFYGVAPIAQPASAFQAALTLVTATTAGFGFSTSAAFTAFTNQLENIRASLVLQGLLKGGA